MERYNRRDFLNILNSGTKILVFGGLVNLISACKENNNSIKEIISIETYHSTRIMLTYRNNSDEIIKEQVHHSREFEFKGTIINPKDYLPNYGGNMPCGSFDLDRYQDYIKNKK